jgi:hypothetical protein
MNSTGSAEYIASSVTQLAHLRPMSPSLRAVRRLLLLTSDALGDSSRRAAPARVEGTGRGGGERAYRSPQSRRYILHTLTCLQLCIVAAG